MAFFGLFKSSKVRDAELKTRVRQASNRIDQFIRQLKLQSNRYNGLAKRSFELGDMDQFRDMGIRYLKCLDAMNRWQRYQVRLSAMELQKNEVRTTREFLQGMNALTSSILTGVDTAEVAKVAQDMDLAESRCDELEAALASALDEQVGGVWEAQEEPDRQTPLLSNDRSSENAAPLQDSKQLSTQSRRSSETDPDKQYWSALDSIRQSIQQ